MRFAVAGKISDHYLCAWGELSSSGRAIHPGEAPTRKRICGAASRPWGARCDPACTVGAHRTDPSVLIVSQCGWVWPLTVAMAVAFSTATGLRRVVPPARRRRV